MITEQIARRGLRDAKLLKALDSVPRHLFVLPEDLAWAYSDGPLSIGEGQTISQPYIVALMTSLLKLTPSARILEIGTGSGYQTAILCEMTKEVHSVEIIPELAQRAHAILQQLGYCNFHLHIGDGSLGWDESAPYDGIIVTAAGPHVPPPLIEQLAEGGRLVLPVGGRGFQILEVYERLKEEMIRSENIPVAFVPLLGKYGWK